MRRVIGSATLISAAAGFGGGFISQAFFSPQAAQAQLPGPPGERPNKRPAATEVDAQRFVLVDSAGNVAGEMRMNEHEPEIILYGKDGRIAWRATTHQSGFQPLNLSR